MKLYQLYEEQSIKKREEREKKDKEARMEYYKHKVAKERAEQDKEVLFHIKNLQSTSI